MKTIIIDPQENRRVANLLKSQLERISVGKRERDVDFPGGSYSKCAEYLLPCSEGKLYAMIPGDWGERIPLLFTLNPKIANFTSDVEINIPLGLNRSVGGCFVNDSEEILICNRGRFTSFKSSIPYKVSLEFFKEQLISVNDAGKDANVIYITNLSSPSLVDEISIFVKRLKKLKFRIKIDSQNKGSTSY
jgi:hypothetical protein